MGQIAVCDLAEKAESEKEHKKSFREFLQDCNWNSRRREDRYDAILVDLGRDSKNYAATNYSLEGLDDAVIRRFSTRIPFPSPNMEERLSFLLHVLEKKNLKDKVSKRAARTLSLKMYGTRTNYSEIETFVEESVADAVYKSEPVTERFLLNRIHNEADGAARQKDDPRNYIATAFHEAVHG